MIYKGQQIYKETNHAERGDPDYIPRDEMPEIVCKIRFQLMEVSSWEEYKEVLPYYKNKRNKIRVYLMGREDPITLIEDIDRFDVIMDDFFGIEDNTPLNLN